MKRGTSSRSVAPLLLALAAAALPARGARAFQAAARADSTNPDSITHLQFRNLGPSVAGGRVASVVGIPGDPNTYYVGAGGGGVWKTTDGGNTWKAIFEKQPTASIGAIALAPSNPNIVWVGTGEGNPRNDVVNGHGVYMSPDGGRSWRFAGLEDVGQISRIVVDSTNPDRVFVAALGTIWKPNAQRGVFRTTDGGKTWKKVLFVNDTTGAAELVMQPGNPMVLFASMWQMRRFPWELVDGGPGSGIWRSTDGGDTWTRLKEGLPDGQYGRIALAAAPSNPAHLYALIEAKKGMLWESRDMGDHWTSVSESHALDVRPFYFSLVNVDPTDERHLFFSSFQLQESTDGGKTVHPIERRVHPDHHALWIDPANPRRMIQGNDGGVYVTRDGGRTWRFLNNLPIGQFYMVAVDNSTPYNLCGGLQDNNAWCGPSNTLTGGGSSGAEWRAVTGGDGEYAVPAPSDSSVIYVDSQNGFITRLDLRTGVSRFIRPYLEGVESTEPSKLKYRFNWTSPIAVSPTNADEVFLGANVLFKSTDGGQHWTVISPDVTRNEKAKQVTSGGPIQHDISGAETYNTILSITLAPTDTNVIWLGTDDGNVQVTRDGGRTWTNVRPKAKGLPDEGRVYQVGVSPFDAGTAYVTLDYHMFANDRPYVFKTTDYGKTWTAISAGLPDDAAAHVVREDPNRRGFLVLGTDNGLWYSRDAGAHWRSLHFAFPTAPVFDVQFVKRTKDLVVATHGRGLFVLDDVTPLEELSPEVEAKALHLFSVEPATLWHGDETEGAPASEFRAPNPAPGAVISYYLKKELKPSDAEKAAKHTPVAISVTDARGDTVYAGWGAAKAGIDRFTWRLSYSGATRLTFEPRPPQEEEEQNEPEEGPFGPAVLPGTYTVHVTAAGQTLSEPVSVRADPRIPFDTAAARAQLAAGLELRDQVSAEAKMLNGLHSLRTQIANLRTTLRETAGSGAGAGAGASKDTTVLHAADALDKKIQALMDTVYNPDVQRGVIEDDIHHLQRFHDQLMSLGFVVLYPYNQAPNDLVKEAMSRLGAELKGYLARYDELLKQDVAAFDRLAQEKGAPVLVAGGSVAVGR
ncbi:MAG TPA: hypothetical protein VF041_01150 [Gemmatimonadaceae bacterium]